MIGSGSIWFWRVANFGRSRLSGGQSRLESPLRAELPALHFVNNVALGRIICATKPN
jgi:hypothetical protein